MDGRNLEIHIYTYNYLIIKNDHFMKRILFLAFLAIGIASCETPQPATGTTDDTSTSGGTGSGTTGSGTTGSGTTGSGTTGSGTTGTGSGTTGSGTGTGTGSGTDTTTTKKPQ